jgi:hypothetical protein
MPQTLVLLEHDGKTYRAEVLAQYRIEGRWRVRVHYCTAPGERARLRRYGAGQGRALRGV